MILYAMSLPNLSMTAPIIRFWKTIVTISGSPPNMLNVYLVYPSGTLPNMFIILQNPNIFIIFLIPIDNLRRMC